MLFGPFHAEVGGLSATSHDQVVVFDEAVVELYLLGVGVYAGNGAHPEADVVVATEDVAHIVGNVVRFQPGHCHLVEKRLKLVVVVAINQGNLNGGAP